MAFNFKKVIDNFNRLKQDLPKQIANEGQKYFIKGFDSQQWDGVAWVPRKDRTNLRKLLVRKARLRRALANAKREVSFSRIRFEVYVQGKNGYNYAEIHNEGGTINMESSKKTLRFREFSTNLGTGAITRRFATNKKGVRKYLRATSELEVNVGAHTIVMPKRKFLGHSKKLDLIIRKKIDTAVANCFK